MPGTRRVSDAMNAARKASGLRSGRSAFFERVFVVVSRVPRGRVTTYGAIARALGTPRAARSVGWALSVAPGEGDLPCHRVVDRHGFLSGGWHWGHPDIMAALLQAEGVPFLDSHQVDLGACLWIPDEQDIDHGERPAKMVDSPITARSLPD